MRARSLLNIRSHASAAALKLRKTVAIKTPTISRPTLPPPQPVSGNDAIGTATLELLASWRLQDATTDPEQIRAAEQEPSSRRR